MKSSEWNPSRQSETKLYLISTNHGVQDDFDYKDLK